jgi:hypothetical protein
MAIASTSVDTNSFTCKTFYLTGYFVRYKERRMLKIRNLAGTAGLIKQPNTRPKFLTFCGI